MTAKTHDMKRRSALKIGLGITGAFLGSGMIGKAFAAVCGATPAQTEGPFYPVAHQPDEDSDLTFVNGKTAHASGQVVYISGQVLDPACAPVAGALVEIWQACASGRYNHPNDTNTAPLDPNFQYWGRTVTDATGRYLFKTIKPGAYPADVDWMRPPHVHFKVHKMSYHELTTQMYFDGEHYNDTDKILKALSAEDQKRVIVPFKASGPELDPGSQSGVFDLTLTKV